MPKWSGATLLDSLNRFPKTGLATWPGLFLTLRMDGIHTAAWPPTTCSNPACKVHEKSLIRKGVLCSFFPFTPFKSTRLCPCHSTRTSPY